MRAGRALGQLPFVFEEVFEIIIAPLGRRLRPCDLESARDRVRTFAGPECALPSEPFLLERCVLGVGAEVLGVARAVAFSERVSTGDERDGFLVVHRHAGEGFTDVACRRERIRVAVGTLGVHVNEPHLHGSERVFQLAVAGVALVAEPFLLGPPIHIFLGLPDVFASAAEAERLEAHRLEGDVAGEDHQIRPGKFASVFLLDRPEQAARLVEVDVVRPAVERRKTLVTGATAAAAVGNAVGACAVPRHADEQRTVVPEVSGPPVLRVGHERREILFHRRKVEALEFLGVIELLTHRISLLRLLAEHFQVELVRPPVAVRCSSAGDLASGLSVVEGAFGFCRHNFFLVGFSGFERFPAHGDGGPLRRRGEFRNY